MKIKIIENIVRIVNVERAKFVSNFKTQISEEFQLFPKQILTGKFEDNKVNAKINPPSGLVDPFKSIVTGTIESDNNSTKLNLKVSPSWTIRIFLTIWYVLILLMTINYNYSGFSNLLKFIGLELIWILIPLVLTRLKVRWDRIRLERKIK
jgi:hypothetical protein|tara:strand:+ start:437 stop:889 length:453 start_codon:yes stop_codon:yes gene_type:complete